MSFYFKITSYIIVLFISYRLRVYLRNKFTKSRDNDKSVDKQMVLFFPETQIKSKDFSQLKCDVLITNNPNSDLCQLLSVLKSCQHSLDVCMYCLSFEPIIQLLEDLSLNNGIVIRIIINDSNKSHSLASEVQGMTGNRFKRIKRMFRSGIECKIISLSNEGLMHNKFAIIDNCLLINGSLNWTENAIFSSYNDCLITSDSKIVLKYCQEFNNYWSFDSY